MFSVITNIYNKKTKGPTLIELFTETGQMTFFLLTTRDFHCVHHGWHGTDRYDIQVLAIHASTWVHRYSSLLRCSVPLGQRGHVAMVGRILCTKCTLHSNHRLTRVIFQHTKRLLPDRPFSHYIHSHRLAAKVWTTMKSNLQKKKWVVPSICTGFVNTCPMVFLQIKFVIPEYIMKRPVFPFVLKKIILVS